MYIYTVCIYIQYVYIYIHIYIYNVPSQLLPIRQWSHGNSCFITKVLNIIHKQ